MVARQKFIEDVAAQVELASCAKCHDHPEGCATCTIRSYCLELLEKAIPITCSIQSQAEQRHARMRSMLQGAADMVLRTADLVQTIAHEGAHIYTTADREEEIIVKGIDFEQRNLRAGAYRIGFYWLREATTEDFTQGRACGGSLWEDRGWQLKRWEEPSSISCILTGLMAIMVMGAASTI